MSADRAAMLLTRFNAAQHALIGRLRDLPAEAASHRPAEGAWSAAQIGCHVAITNEWSARILSGETPGAQPAPPDFVESFSPASLPATIKTLPALEPPGAVSCEAALERLRASGHHMARAIASLTPARGAGLCVVLPFGMLSLFELADFTTAHVVRHVAQIERTVAGA
jgi:hypothetical protein